MTKDWAIKVEGLLKQYIIYDRQFDRFLALFLKSKKYKVFKALGPLDLEIKKGEALGIVGENGAGKSTLLKLISGVLEPSGGRIEVRGKVSSILELGTGFHPEFTGRENACLNAALYGLSPSEIEGRMIEIERFADIGEFMDMPVKTYSSGMYMRLAFSLSVHVNSDILIIDEALAVGDGIFMKKCIDKIIELKKAGTTILFCSHSLYTIANFCDRVLWLKNGALEAIGDAKEVLLKYEDYLRSKEKAIKEHSFKKAGIVAQVTNITLLSNGERVDGSIPYRSSLEVIIDFEVLSDVHVYVGFAIDRNDGLCCYAESMISDGIKPFRGPGLFKAKIIFKDLKLFGGPYKFVAFLMDDSGICIFDRKESSFFTISTDKKKWGLCYLDHEWIC